VGRRRHACVLRERQEPSRPAEAVVEGRLDLRLPPARATVHHGELVEREPHHGTRQGQVWEEIKPSFQSAIAGGVLSPCAAGNRRPPPPLPLSSIAAASGWYDALLRQQQGRPAAADSTKVVSLQDAKL